MNEKIENLGDNIGNLYRVWQKTLSKKLAPYNLTPEQSSILTDLFISPGLSQNEIAIKRGKEHSTIVRLLQRMEKKGLIKRKKETKDNRIHKIYITEKGREGALIHYRCLREVLDIALRGVSERTQEFIIKVYKVMIENLSEE